LDDNGAVALAAELINGGQTIAAKPFFAQKRFHHVDGSLSLSRCVYSHGKRFGSSGIVHALWISLQNTLYFLQRISAKIHLRIYYKLKKINKLEETVTFRQILMINIVIA
jgi:hypothetical protein